MFCLMRTGPLFIRKRLGFVWIDQLFVWNHELFVRNDQLFIWIGELFVWNDQRSVWKVRAVAWDLTGTTWETDRKSLTTRDLDQIGILHCLLTETFGRQMRESSWYGLLYICYSSFLDSWFLFIDSRESSINFWKRSVRSFGAPPARKRSRLSKNNS